MGLVTCLIQASVTMTKEQMMRNGCRSRFIQKRMSCRMHINQPNQLNQLNQLNLLNQLRQLHQLHQLHQINQIN